MISPLWFVCLQEVFRVCLLARSLHTWIMRSVDSQLISLFGVGLHSRSLQTYDHEVGVSPFRVRSLQTFQEVYRLMTMRSVSLHLGFVCLQEVFTLGSWGPLILSWSLCSGFVCIQEVYRLMTLRSVVSKLMFLFRVCLHSRSLQTSTLRTSLEVHCFSADLIC